MSKPEFDPNKAFEIAEGQKPEFDPTQAFEAMSNSAQAPKPQSWKDYLLRGATGAIPYAAGIAGGIAGAPLGVGGAVGGGALGYSGGKEIERLANHYLLGDEIPQENPVEATKRVGGNALEGAALEAGGQAINAAGPLVERFATTPLFDKLSRSTNVVGQGKNLLGKVAEKLGGEELSPAVKNTVDAASGLSGRAAVYKTPLGLVQGVSDLSRAATYAQKGAAWLADNGPAQKAISTLMQRGLPQYANQLSQAKDASDFALKYFTLSQTDPNFRKAMESSEQ